MQLPTHNPGQITAEIFSKALRIVVLVVFLAACSENETPQSPAENAATNGFTFFELGRNSVLSKSTRNDLGSKLGRDAVEKRSILDLEINYPGFLKTYFPQMDQLNQKLNFPPAERVEHNTVKLMYRYAQKKNIPFDYVELVFSNYTQKPILFRIHFQKDESNIIKTLETKYGPSQTIKWEKENGTSFYWTKDNDALIVSLVPDQFGTPKYQIVIYFAGNLNALITTEQKEKAQKEQERAKSGKTAF